ncbi:MAG: pilin [bacterium]
MKKFIPLIIALSIFIFCHPVRANGLLPECDISGEGRACELNDFLALAVNLINYMLAIAGSLALLFFIYGGFKWLTAAGNSSKVDEGKQVLISATFGILVVLASWMIVNFVYTTLYGTGQEGGIKKEWWKN